MKFQKNEKFLEGDERGLSKYRQKGKHPHPPDPHYLPECEQTLMHKNMLYNISKSLQNLWSWCIFVMLANDKDK